MDYLEERSDKVSRYTEEQSVIDHFLSLKKVYEEERKPWEYQWDQALSAVYMTDNLENIYESEAGRANIKSPIMHWKVNGIVSRLMRVLFSAVPFARIEDRNVIDDGEIDVIELWNEYMFGYQLDCINFKTAFEKHLQNKTIQGSAVAKITQEYESRMIDYFGGLEPEEMVVKDDTYFRPILLKEFYSDVNKMDVNESEACIHSTTIRLSEIIDNEKEEYEEEITDENGDIVGYEKKTRGVYHNIDLLLPNDTDNNAVTVEQEEYMDILGLSSRAKSGYIKELKETKKTGVVKIDECYGRYEIDGEVKEVIAVIANGRILIRFEETPFKHKRYTRPFIVGRYHEIPNCLYGQSNVILGLNLLYELNATRAQAIDAKTRAVSNMWYEDMSQQVVWEKVWRPNGIVRGLGPNGLQPILNPYLGHVTINDTTIIQRDLDQLWSLSPVQEGTSDSRMIPSTRGGTLAIIAQNDMPLNRLINRTTDNEIKTFLEMLYERNLTFKTSDDLLAVWPEEKLQKLGIQPNMDMREFMIDPAIKVLGNLELSNELSQQTGYMNFLNYAQQNPEIAKRVNWKVTTEKLLKSFGIKDDCDGIFLDDDVVAQAEQQRAQQQQQAQQQQLQMADQLKQKDRMEELQDYKTKKEIDTEAKIVEKTAINTNEVLLEKKTGQKI